MIRSKLQSWSARTHTHTRTRTHTHPTFKYMTWWEFGIAHVVCTCFYNKTREREREIFTRKKSPNTKRYKGGGETAPGPDFQQFAKHKNSPTFLKRALKLRE